MEIIKLSLTEILKIIKHINIEFETICKTQIHKNKNIEIVQT